MRWEQQENACSENRGDKDLYFGTRIEQYELTGIRPEDSWSSNVTLKQQVYPNPITSKIIPQKKIMSNSLDILSLSLWPEFPMVHTAYRCSSALFQSTQLKVNFTRRATRHG